MRRNGKPSARAWTAAIAAPSWSFSRSGGRPSQWRPRNTNRDGVNHRHHRPGNADGGDRRLAETGHPEDVHEPKSDSMHISSTIGIASRTMARFNGSLV